MNNVTLNMAFVGILLSIIPEIIDVIAETVEAVQVNFSDKPGAEKKKQVVEAVQAWYNAFDKKLGFSPEVDQRVNESIPPLVDLIYSGAKFLLEEAA